MANLGQKGGVYHVRFRYRNREYKKSLKTRDPSAAAAARHLVELTLHRLLTGQARVPDGVDPGDFVVSGGTRAAPGPTPASPAALAPVPSTRELAAGFGDAQRPLIAASYHSSQAMHLRHLLRHLGDRADEPADPPRKKTAIESLDPALQLAFLREAGAWIEHELPASVGLRSGLVWRGERRPFMRQNATWPFDAFTVPFPVIDPGPDGRRGTADDGAAIELHQLGSGLADLPAVHVVRNVPDAGSHYWTWEVTATRRASGRWSLVAGLAHTWSREQAGAYAGQPVRQNMYPLTPNDLINTGEDGRHEFRIWTARLHGTYMAPWGVRVTPLLRQQAGQPFGRTFVAQTNYGSVRVLAEPIGTRRMDHITLLDVRVEKGVPLGGHRHLAGFVDVFNLLNANPTQNASWSSGGAFLRPLSILPPRAARAGVKLQW